jgi:hypothetical protein
LVLFLCALAGASTAAASTTIGQLAPGSPPPAECTGSPFDLLQPTVTSGNTYVVPAEGVAITSWSTSAAAGAGQMMEMKAFRQVSGTTYKVVGHDGPHALVPSTVNTFATNIAVQPGDVLGLNDVNATGSVPNACDFVAPGDSERYGPGTSGGNLADGMSGDFSNSSADVRLNVTAEVAIKPSNNSFTFGKVKDKNNGTATLAVKVPGPGTLSLTGKGVKTQRAGGGAVASKTVSAGGTVKLSIKPKGKAKSKLKKTGKAKVKVSVIYTPMGDVRGDPNTQTKRVKLIKKH